jgi:hypothetical protein
VELDAARAAVENTGATAGEPFFVGERERDVRLMVTLRTQTATIRVLHLGFSGGRNPFIPWVWVRLNTASGGMNHHGQASARSARVTQRGRQRRSSGDKKWA